MLLREKLERVRAERRRAEEERRRLYEERLRIEGHVAGRNEGLLKERQRWVPWYERFKAAEERGEPFDEPPPHKR